MVPGLFLALLAAFFVLAANDHWLFPALDRTGVLYLDTAPLLADGASPEIPVAAWDAPTPFTGLEGQGTLMPLIMAGLVRSGARPHVAGLWIVAAGLGIAVFALAWAAGGVAGVGGAVAAGLLVLVSPLTRDAATVLGPDTLLAALVAVLAGVMTYQPRWWILHGTLAALAWLIHPAGVGAVAAAAVWAAARSGAGSRRVGAAAISVAPAALLLAAGTLERLLSPPGLSGGRQGLAAALGGVARWGAAGHAGPVAVALGLAAVGAGVLLVVVEALSTPPPPHEVHWSDPAAPDVLARTFRPAAGLLALGTLVGAAMAGPLGTLDRPWLPTALLLGTLGAAAGVRWTRRAQGSRAWAPLVLLGVWGGLAAWSSARGLARFRQEGRGVTAAVWVDSPLIRWLDNRSSGYPRIYATDPVLVYLQTGRGARGMPGAGVPLEAFARIWRANPGPLVITGTAPEAWIRELEERLGTVEEMRTDEGRILVPARDVGSMPGSDALAPGSLDGPQPGVPTPDPSAPERHVT